ncbi:MAG: helix-turn-helix domain-containing protein [Bacteroidota bacterium]
MNLSFEQLPEAIADLIKKVGNIEQLLTTKSLALPNQEPAPELGGIDLAIKVTGFKKPTIYGKVQRGEIPHYKRGGRLFFTRQSLCEWIMEGKVKTAAEIELEANDYLKGKRKK